MESLFIRKNNIQNQSNMNIFHLKITENSINDEYPYIYKNPANTSSPHWFR